MISFFKKADAGYLAVEVEHAFSSEEIEKLTWLFSGAEYTEEKEIGGWFVGPRREMITPWSTNAVEITQNMAIAGISRIEEYFPVKGKDSEHDPMLQRIYAGLDQSIFTIDKQPDPIVYIDDLVSEMFGVKNPENVIFTLNATDSLNIAIKGFLNEGDHAIFSSMEKKL